MKNLTKAMMIIAIISLLFSCSNNKLITGKRTSKVYHNYKKVESSNRTTFSRAMIIPLQQTLTSELEDCWFVFANKFSFTIYYGKSCQEQFVRDAGDSIVTKPNNADRLEFFNGIGPDSVRYYSGVSSIYGEKEKSHKNNGILKFQIYFKREWSEDKYKKVLKTNDSLKEIILQKPLGKSNIDVFSDYRFWLPQENYFGKIAENFERLPYYSEKYKDFSIFIVPDKPYYFSGVSNVEDETIEKKRRIALKKIAKVFGIKVYHLVN